MRNKNWPDYPIPYIKISIADKGKFADMAYFFDFPPVLEEIARVRINWLAGKTIPNSETEDFIANGGNDPKKASNFWRNHSEGVKIAKKFHKSVNYVRPIIAAILSGEVSNEDYSTIFVEDPTHHYLPSDLLIENKIAYVTNRIRQVDVKALNNPLDTKSLGTVKRDRKWFLLFTYEHMGYKKLAKFTKEKETTVVSALNSYLSYMSDSFDLEFRIDAHKKFQLKFNTQIVRGM